MPHAERGGLGDVAGYLTQLLDGTDRTGAIKGAITAQAAARSILAAARARRNEVFVPFKWTLVAAVIRNIPSFLFKGMNI